MRAACAPRSCGAPGRHCVERAAGAPRSCWAPGRQCTESCPRAVQLAELEAKGKVLPSSSGDYQLVQKIAERVIKAVEAGRGGGFQDHVRKCAARWGLAGAGRLQAGHTHPLWKSLLAQSAYAVREARLRGWCSRLVRRTHSRSGWAVGSRSPPAAVLGTCCLPCSAQQRVAPSAADSGAWQVAGPSPARHETRAHLSALRCPAAAGSTGRSWWWRTRRPTPSCCPAARSSCSPVRPRTPLRRSLPHLVVVGTCCLRVRSWARGVARRL